MNRTILQITFHAVCVLATIGLAIKCLFDYFRNENVSVVEYHKFQQNSFSGYPSFSLCFINPFLEDKLKAHGTFDLGYNYEGQTIWGLPLQLVVPEVHTNKQTNNCCNFVY